MKISHFKLFTRVLFLMFIIFLLQKVNAQPWLDKLPKKVNVEPYGFYEYQKAFNDYWEHREVIDGFYMENGIRKKAYGWKQFQRWQWNMQTQVDLQTGYLPAYTAQQVYESYLKTLSLETRSTASNWKSLGVNGVGRVNCVAFHPSDMNTYWVGAPAGGLWATNDNGISWSCLTDKNAVLGVSDIIIPSDYPTSKTIYIATGDRDSYDNNSVGVLKSKDGGITWNTTGLSFTLSTYNLVTRLLLDPVNNQSLIAATTSGVYKTTNGGNSWSLISSTNFIDMEYKPGDFNTLYGATKTGLFYLSANGGASWSQTLNIANGRRMELAVSQNQPAQLYAVVAATDGGLFGVYKSVNSGSSFTQVFSGATKNLLGWDESQPGGQGSYDLSLAVSPTNANIVLVGGIITWRSSDGGTSWSYNSQNTHVDKHMLRYRPNGYLYECNDGGIYLSSDNGTSWINKTSGLGISQMYKLGVSRNNGGENITGLQDNGTWLLANGNWNLSQGGDGMECIIDYSNANVQYGSYQRGSINRTLDHWLTRVSITPSNAGTGGWVTPYVIDPVDPNILYAGYADVWKTIDKGNTWTKISNINSPYKLRAIAVAPSNNQVIYVVDNDDKIWKSISGGGTWTNITGTLPVSSSYLTNIAIKSADANVVWVSMGQYNVFKVFQSIDGGSTWSNISAGLPELPVYSVLQNTQVTLEVHLYAGTELGVYFKKGLNNWIPFNNALPNVTIGELEIYYNTSNPELSKLRAATYGRGLWESNVYYEAVSNAITVPTEVSATDGTYTDRVTVTWAGNSGNYFQVYRNTTNNNNTATILGSWQTGTSFNDFNATTNQTYYYWVRAASNNSGANISSYGGPNTGWRSPITVTTPTSVTASDGAYTDRVTVSWAGTSGNYFQIYRNTTNSTGTATALGSWQTSTSYNDFSAAINQTYYYWVRAASNNSGANISSYGGPNTGWRSPITVTTPTSVTATDGSYTDRVTVTWTGTSGNYFQIYRNTTNNSSTATTVGSWQSSTSYNDFTAATNQTYYYWVRAASNSSGVNISSYGGPNTGWRGSITVTTPSSVTASDGAYTDRVTVSWAGTSGNYFQVYRNTTNNNSTATTLGSWQTSTSYNDLSATTNQTYYYWVRAASNSSGANISSYGGPNTGWRSSITVTTPSSVTATDGAYIDRVTVSWAGTSGNYFQVYRNTTNSTGTATALGSWLTSTSYNDFSATTNQTYYYWVRAASNSSGANISSYGGPNTGWRSSITVTTPTSVTATDGAYTDRVTVSWAGTSGNYFQVYRNTTNSTGTATALGSWQTSTSYNDFSAAINQTYYYWVRAASNNSGANISSYGGPNTGWRSPITVTTPTSVTATDGSYTDRVTVTWTGTSGNYFQIYRNTTNNSSTATTVGSWQSSTSYNDFTAATNQTYYYWVRAASNNSGANVSSYSGPNTGWRSAIIVTVPTSVSATDGTYTDRVTVTWAGTSGNYFQVYRNTTNNSSAAITLGAWQNSISYNDLTATANQTYYYWVRAASNSSGSNISSYGGPNTGWRSNSSTCVAPSGLKASQITSSACVLSWNIVSGASQYSLWYYNGSSWIQFGTTTQNTAGVGSMSSGFQYCFAIKSICGSTSSNFSASVCIVTLSGLQNTAQSSTHQSLPELIVAELNETVISLFPNPVKASAEFSIKYYSLSPTEANIQIIDVSGRLIDNQELQINLGENNIKMHASLNSGIYILRLKSKNGDLSISKLNVN